MRRRTLLALPLLGGCAIPRVEEPAFSVVDRQGPVEIREVAPRLLAEVEVEGDDEAAARNAGFRALFAFISGANIPMTAPVAQSGGERIAMTAPVTQSRDGARWRIGFVMPAGMTLAAAPRPTDRAVALREEPGGAVAVLRFNGVATADRVAGARARLASAIALSPWEGVGEGGAWFYDPPWTLPALRRNEAWLPVRPRAA